MRISEYLRQSDILPELTSTSKEQVLEELSQALASRYIELDAAVLLEALHERERLGSTGIGDGIAIPHAKLKGLGRLYLLFACSRSGVRYDSLDGRPAHLFFLLVSPDEATGSHLRMLARVSRLLKDAAVRDRLLHAGDSAAMHAIISAQDQQR